jgi:hypothetical protein
MLKLNFFDDFPEPLKSQILGYKAKTTHTTMSIRFKIKASMNEF